MSRIKKTAFDRVMDKVTRDELTGCWNFTGSLNQDGYGRIAPDEQGIPYTHRVTYCHVVGAVPKGMDLDHLCRNRQCCNPAHLEPVSRTVNMRRAYSGKDFDTRETHCPRGHEMAGENVYMYTHKPGKQYPRCKVCARQATQNWRERNRGGKRNEAFAVKPT